MSLFSNSYLAFVCGEKKEESGGREIIKCENPRGVGGLEKRMCPGCLKRGEEEKDEEKLVVGRATLKQREKRARQRHAFCTSLARSGDADTKKQRAPVNATPQQNA